MHIYFFQKGTDMHLRHVRHAESASTKPANAASSECALLLSCSNEDGELNTLQGCTFMNTNANMSIGMIEMSQSTDKLEEDK